MENNAITVIPQQELKEIATAACKSGLFPMPNPESAFMLMLICQSEGLHPVQALKRYHVIKGRPTMRSDAMQAEFQRAGGKIEWSERTDKVVRATFSHPSGGSVPVEWTIEMAQKAGLTSKDVWKQFPRQMLTARVISEGIRTILPGIVTGIYTPEEIQDLGAIDIEDASITGQPQTTIGSVISAATSASEPPKKTTKATKPAETTKATETTPPKTEQPKTEQPKTEPEKYKCSACGRISETPHGACKCAEGKIVAVSASTPELTPAATQAAASTGTPSRGEMQKEITSTRAQKRIQTADWQNICASVGIKDMNAAAWTDEQMFKVLTALRAK